MYTKVLILFIFISKTFCSLQNNDRNILNEIEENECYSGNKTRNCVRKCCPFGQGYNPDILECVNATGFKIDLWDRNLKISDANMSEFDFVIGFHSCPINHSSLQGSSPSIAKELHLEKNGYLHIKWAPNIPTAAESNLGPDLYCVDMFLKEDENKNIFYEGDFLVCTPDEEMSEKDKTRHIIDGVCMLISCFFMSLTVGVYFWIPELHNKQGILLAMYLICLFVFFLFVGIRKILFSTALVNGHIEEEVCLGLFFPQYFSEMAAFLWLSVLSFDIWWRLRIIEKNLNKLTVSGNPPIINFRYLKSQNFVAANAKFSVYSLYAFGIATLMTIVILALELKKPIKHDLMPNIVLRGCNLERNSKWLYEDGLIALLCIVNTIFFLLTAIRMIKPSRDSRILNSAENFTTNRVKRAKQSFCITLKLFVLMGTNWMIEIISSFWDNGSEWWIILDVYCGLIGLFIFFTLVCTRKTYKLLKNRIAKRQRESNSRQAIVASESESSRSIICRRRPRNQMSISSAGTSISASSNKREGSVRTEPETAIIHPNPKN